SPGDLKTNLDNLSITLNKKYAAESGLYISNEQTVNDYIKLKYGLRFSNFTVLGPNTTYTYNENHERIDSVVYATKSIIKNYPALEPRFSATFVVNTTSSIKASFTKNNQYVHLIQSSTSS